MSLWVGGETTKLGDLGGSLLTQSQPQRPHCCFLENKSEGEDQSKYYYFKNKHSAIQEWSVTPFWGVQPQLIYLNSSSAD